MLSYTRFEHKLSRPIFVPVSRCKYDPNSFPLSTSDQSPLRASTLSAHTGMAFAPSYLKKEDG